MGGVGAGEYRILRLVDAAQLAALADEALACAGRAGTTRPGGEPDPEGAGF